MADKVSFDLVSPERLLFSEDVEMVVVPGTEGDFGVLAGHAPLMSTLRPGLIEIHDGGEPRKVFVAGGFAEVTPAGLTVLAEEAEAASDVTGEMIDRLVAAAEQQAEASPGTPEADAARGRIDQLSFVRGQLGV